MTDELAPRRIPKQRRSREIVDAIVEAGRHLLEERGPEALTTNAVAERAGVSIGSLYRYFPSRAAVLAAIYDRDASREAADLTGESWPLDALPLEEALAALVDLQLERHRRLLGMEEDFYRDHHGEFSLAGRLGSDDVVARIRAILSTHAERLRVSDLDHAAFLVARGVSAIVRLTLAERPEKLDEPAFRRELVDLMVRYVVANDT
jgi:AcrR family transcriptional regulator